MAKKEILEMECPHCTIMAILDNLVEVTGDAEASATVMGMVLGDVISSASDPDMARRMLADIYCTAFNKATGENTNNALACAQMLGFNFHPIANDERPN